MRVLILVLGLLIITAVASAADDKADLNQTLNDLSSQLEDKQRLDTQAAVKVELSQARSWLSEAGNAIKEDRVSRARQLFERVRAQLKLLDQRIALSQLQAELNKLQQGLGSARQGLEKARKQLEEKRVQLKAMQMNEK